jgi:hypothetical protein
VKQGEVLIVEDVSTYPQPTAIEQELLDKGWPNVVVAPLYYQDDLIGMLTLLSPYPGDLHALNTMKLREVLPLFAMAIHRGMEELNTRIQAIIKEQCTAIHPAVEWRFRQAAIHWAEKRQEGTMAEMEPIVFNDVYPLYGVSDIRSSSHLRSTAIQADLTEHLGLAKEILQLAYGCKPLPILDALAFHVGQLTTQISTGLGAGDEVSIIDFLHREVEPLFDHLRGFCPEVEENIQAYQAAIEPHLGTVYRRRKNFEESVTQINEALSAYIDAEQEKAQAMFPHYFEKHKTDGVEYSIYIGASMVEDSQFDPLYLHNLRLWQLLVMCGVARLSEQLKDRLHVPLDLAHLVLVQHTPLAVRFRLDEKRFDIDGAYNMRYEIVKKRIDKARLKDSTERLTQPGKIAIVYSQSKEIQEYWDYIDYLRTRGHLTAEVEDVELEDLDGAQGLRALRVTVDMREVKQQASLSLEEVSDMVRTRSPVTP